MLVKRQQLELDMERQTGSKFGKEYIKDVCCHPAYLAYIQGVCVCVYMCLVAQSCPTLVTP